MRTPPLPSSSSSPSLSWAVTLCAYALCAALFLGPSPASAQYTVLTIDTFAENGATSGTISLPASGMLTVTQSGLSGFNVIGSVREMTVQATIQPGDSFFSTVDATKIVATPDGPTAGSLRTQLVGSSAFTSQATFALRYAATGVSATGLGANLIADCPPGPIALCLRSVDLILYNVAGFTATSVTVKLVTEAGVTESVLTVAPSSDLADTFSRMSFPLQAFGIAPGVSTAANFANVNQIIVTIDARASAVPPISTTLQAIEILELEVFSALPPPLTTTIDTPTTDFPTTGELFFPTTEEPTTTTTTTTKPTTTTTKRTTTTTQTTTTTTSTTTTTTSTRTTTTTSQNGAEAPSLCPGNYLCRCKTGAELIWQTDIYGCPTCLCRWLPGQGPSATTTTTRARTTARTTAGAPTATTTAATAVTRRTTAPRIPTTTMVIVLGAWNTYNDRQYRFFPETRTFHAAEAECINNGGHLASISNSDELKFVFRQYNEDSGRSVWIGGIRTAGGSFRWTDSTPFAFQQWAINEPDLGKSETCVFVGNNDRGVLSNWFDGSCDKLLAFVCERAA